MECALAIIGKMDAEVPKAIFAKFSRFLVFLNCKSGIINEKHYNVL